MDKMVTVATKETVNISPSVNLREIEIALELPTVYYSPATAITVSYRVNETWIAYETIVL